MNETCSLAAVQFLDWALLAALEFCFLFPSSLPSIFPSIRVFPNESVLHIRWPKYWSFSFSISPSNEYSGLISFQIDWFDLPALQGILESSLTPQFKNINFSVLSFLYSLTLTSIIRCYSQSNDLKSHFQLSYSGNCYSMYFYD